MFYLKLISKKIVIRIVVKIWGRQSTKQLLLKKPTRTNVPNTLNAWEIR
jgi:hypothetical protein